MKLSEFRNLPIEELVKEAQSLGFDNAGNFRPCELIFELVCHRVKQGEDLVGSGVLEILPEGFGFLRSPVSEYAPGADDIYVSPSQIRRFNLRTGDRMSGRTRIPRDSERYFALLQIKEVNGNSPEQERTRLHFDSKSVSQPESLVKWSSKQSIDVHQQLGTRCGSKNLLIVKKFQNPLFMLNQLLMTLSDSSLLLMLNAAVEDITYLRSKWTGEIFVSYRGDSAQRHQQILHLAQQRAKRLAEQGKDINYIICSLNEVALSAKNHAEQSERLAPSTYGVASVQQLLSLGRSFKEEGSLTIWAIVNEDRSAFECSMLEVALYESTGRYRCDKDAPACIDGTTLS